MVQNRFFLLCMAIAIVLVGVKICSTYFTPEMHTCVIKCPPKNKILKTISYDINGKVKKEQMKKPCILNGWNISHILSFMVLTIVFPEYSLFLFFGGIIWELLEIIWQVENYLDIAWNTIGILLGLTILKITRK